MTTTIGTARPARFLPAPLRRPERRPLAAAALVAAVAHIPVIGPHLDEAPYMGVLFIVLTVACLAIAAAALVRDTTAVYGLTVLTCGLAVLGYAATRVVAFPMLGDDVGNWLEPLGVVSVASELVAVGAAVSALVSRRRRSVTHLASR
ncbi:MAG: hypothetical protein ACXVYC_16645 [Blastococcus sp.]